MLQIILNTKKDQKGLETIKRKSGAAHSKKSSCNNELAFAYRNRSNLSKLDRKSPQSTNRSHTMEHSNKTTPPKQRVLLTTDSNKNNDR